MDYSRQTVDQIKKALKERGVVFPSKARKADLVAMLAEKDVRKKPDVAEGKSKVNLTGAGRPLPQSAATSGLGKTKESVASSKLENSEGWIVETESKYHGDHYEPDTKVVGIYSSKELAIKNARIAFANMDCFMDMDGWDAEDLKDNSDRIEKNRYKGCKGGVLFEAGADTGEGDIIAVNIYKCIMDKPIKPNSVDYNANDSYTEEESESDYE